MVIDLSGVVVQLASDGVDVSVDRPNATTWAAGGFAEAQSFVTTAVPNVSVQPVKGRDLVKLPEGVRASEVITLYAPAFLFAEKDRVTVAGRGVFEVFNANPWGSPVGRYSKALARQLAAGEPRP